MGTVQACGQFRAAKSHRRRIVWPGIEGEGAGNWRDCCAEAIEDGTLQRRLSNHRTTRDPDPA
ncbi:hypothetical protein EMPG_12624 [Blastomyces silverae]|uniref:Uncharacterized protein n=1 Tax=Blastomyces silverae TaxID=2060906 RepID=A0A0H1BT91_9EURO|nr:hypothetical protein EMPG_12624 [Blastomyces silverae]